MKQVVIATKNKGKAEDFKAIFKPLGYEVVTMFDVAPKMEIEETGTTFEENAIIKAETLSKALGQLVIADDSGLIVDALNGDPGVFSARYAGDHDNAANIIKVLKNLKGVPTEERTARFECCIAIAGPGYPTTTFFGRCEGIIAEERLGDNGFGYDPIFYVPEIGKTMAQMSARQKGSISHRGNAIKALKEAIDLL